MTGSWGGFAELAAHTTRGVDYDVVARTHRRDPAIVVAAPHGGGIEPGTAELATWIAGGDHTLYAFQGLRAHANDALHLTSARFDEPTALELVTTARTAVTVHGCRGRRSQVYVGGLNTGLACEVSHALARAGFPVADPPAGLQGRKPTNLTNRPRQAGVQLELSWPLRRRLLGSLTGGAVEPAPTKAGWAFVTAVRRAVAAWHPPRGQRPPRPRARPPDPPRASRRVSRSRDPAAAPRS